MAHSRNNWNNRKTDELQAILDDIPRYVNFPYERIIKLIKEGADPSMLMHMRFHFDNANNVHILTLLAGAEGRYNEFFHYLLQLDILPEDERDQILTAAFRAALNSQYPGSDGIVWTILTLVEDVPILREHLISIMRRTEKSGIVSSQEERKQTALNKIDAILLKRPLLVNQRGVNGFSNNSTPLMLAIKKAEIPIDTSRLLLSHGANPNLQDENGTTPLMLAAKRDFPTLQLLLQHNADPFIKDKKGNTALDYVKSKIGTERLKLAMKPPNENNEKKNNEKKNNSTHRSKGKSTGRSKSRSPRKGGKRSTCRK